MSDERSEYRDPPDAGGLIPPGWFIADHAMRPDLSLKGYLARGQGVQGRCASRECQRRAWMDLGELMRLTGPGLQVKKLAAYMKCSRLEGCRFTFTQLEPRCDIPLSRFRGRPNVRLRLRCGRCLGYVHRRVDAVIRWLSETGQGGEQTWISDVERKLTARCPCRASDWAIEVIVFDLNEPRWRKHGEAVFEDRPGRPPGQAGPAPAA